METELRHADLQTLHNALTHEAMHRLDVIVPAHKITFTNSGEISFTHHIAEKIDETGVTPASSATEWLTPTTVAQDQLADKLGIPRQYWGKCRDSEPNLLAENVNTWLGRETDSLYVRGLSYPQGGVARAVLSDRFRAIDDIDVITAFLEGVSQSGITPSDLNIECDRSMRRMYVRVNAPAVTIEALDLTSRYVDPRTGRSGRDYPVVSAGLIMRNSDVGHGAFLVSPQITFLVCKNGMTRTDESMRKVHLGGQQEDGLIEWSDETLRRELSLITSKATDAVSQFLTVDYLQKTCDEIRKVSGRPINEPQETVHNVTKKLQFSKEEQQLVFNAFIQSSDPTALGLAQAITLVAQGDMSADRADEMERSVWRAMTLAAAA